MKILPIVFILSCSLFGFSQEKIKMIIGVSGAFSSEFIESNRSSQTYGGIRSDLGARFQVAKSDVDLRFIHQFSSNIISYNSQTLYYNDGYVPSHRSMNSLLRSHYIGSSLKFVYLNREKKIRPYFEIIALKEIATNYENGYLLDEEFIPRDQPKGQGEFHDPYYSLLYHSTPFVGSIIIGCNIRLIENLELSLGIGYGYRNMRTKFAYWYDGVDFEKVVEKIPIKEVESHMIDAQLGLSYAFSFKTKEKP